MIADPAVVPGIFLVRPVERFHLRRQEKGLVRPDVVGFSVNLQRSASLQHCMHDENGPGERPEAVPRLAPFKPAEIKGQLRANIGCFAFLVHEIFDICGPVIGDVGEVGNRADVRILFLFIEIRLNQEISQRFVRVISVQRSHGAAASGGRNDSFVYIRMFFHFSIPFRSRGPARYP